jgi:hypothetical protein
MCCTTAARRSRRGDPVVELDADHRPWMSRPEEFIEAVDQVVHARVGQPR